MEAKQIEQKEYLKDYLRHIKRTLERIRQLNCDEELKKAAEKYINYLYLNGYTLARQSYYCDKLIRVLPLSQKLSLEENDLMNFLMKIREQKPLMKLVKKST